MNLLNSTSAIESGQKPASPDPYPRTGIFQGQEGIIEAHYGAHVMPDQNALGNRIGEHLYCVRFDAGELWGKELLPSIWSSSTYGNPTWSRVNTGETADKSIKDLKMSVLEKNHEGPFLRNHGRLRLLQWPSLSQKQACSAGRNGAAN